MRPAIALALVFTIVAPTHAQEKPAKLADLDNNGDSVSNLLRALETFQALGIDFVSLSESMDTSTPAGKMVFTENLYASSEFIFLMLFSLAVF